MLIGIIKKKDRLFDDLSGNPINGFIGDPNDVFGGNPNADPNICQSLYFSFCVVCALPGPAAR